MANKIITVSIIGVGARGGEAYGRYINRLKDKYKIVALCDTNGKRLQKYGDAYGIPEIDRFSDENVFFEKKRSDVLIIATLDKLHVRMAKRAIALDYDILLEKPISEDAEELRELLNAAKKTNCKIMVCHVLRYTAMVRKIKELLDSGMIGKLISIDQTENVVYWHEAHSYVRGNWRNREIAAPMIMAKCCHDLDLLQYFAGSKCKSVASMGSLAYFRPEFKPEGAADRCTDCKYVDTCAYSAKLIYLDSWKKNSCPPSSVPQIMITDALPLTEDALMTAIQTGDYGRCVFGCDNDVVDNQTVIMQFENGITATLKMEAFVLRGGRDIRLFGTEGEIEVIEEQDSITLRRYIDHTSEVWKISEISDDMEGQHGGGDHGIINDMYNVMQSDNTLETSLEASVESHYMAIAAEESRLNEGRLVFLDKYRA